MKYLNATNRLTSILRKKNHGILRTGYNQLLERKNNDGSYNLWGYEKSDSIWLTAYVLKCLGHMKYLVSINDRNIFDAMTFLASKQKSDGGFSEYGPLSNHRMQGGVKTETVLAAYVAVSFLENTDYREDFQNVIDKVLKFVDKNIFNISDMHAVAVSAYAFVLANHSSAATLLENLRRGSIVEEKLMFWENEMSSSRSEADTNLSLKIEIAAYALLAFLKSGDQETALSIMNWLMSKRNAEGGFYSTQDTVMGLQALSEIALVHYMSNINMKIKFDYGQDVHIFEVDKNDEITRQELKLPPSSRSFTINANGTGKALLNIWSSYNYKSEIPSEVFKLNTSVLASRNGGSFFLTICVSNLREDERTGMLIMEIVFPSGYIYDSDNTPLLKEFNVKVENNFFFQED